MVATISKNSAGTSWQWGNLRSYDVWGSVRSGATSGGPKGRYVANLGHVQDDESGLIYMRARYYEPETGRFVNQDMTRDGLNWFIYAENNPIMMVDHDGAAAISLKLTGLVGVVIVFAIGWWLSSTVAGADGWVFGLISSILIHLTELDMKIGQFTVQGVARLLDAGKGTLGNFVKWLKSIDINNKKLPPGTGMMMTAFTIYAGILWAELLEQEYGS